MGIIVNLKIKVKELKSELAAMTMAYKDKRTPFVAKLLIGITIGYLLSPIDLIPDFIPVLGLLDDLIIVPILITMSIKLIPTEVMEDARRYLMSNPQQLKKKNWFFAALIIMIWLALGYLIFNYLNFRYP